MAHEESAAHNHNDAAAKYLVDRDPIAVRLRDEISQSARLRQAIMRKIEVMLGRRVVLFYTSFAFDSVAIEDNDASMLDSILQSMDLSSGLTLILNSPGGSGVTAERIIKVCRVYSHDNFEVIVPEKAKSAATMICLGAKRMLMSDTSELGPIDPQVLVTIGNRYFYMPANVVVETYQSLLKDAITAEGRLEPYLLLLERYDPSEIRRFIDLQSLGIDIAKHALQTGMMKDHGDKIGGAVDCFANPRKRMTHERPIYWEEAHDAGLAIEHVENRSDLWLLVSDLHQRADWAVSTRYAKIIETCDQEYGEPAPRE